MKYTIALILLCVSMPLCETHAAGPSKPNIVFILTDDQGYGDVARHGHPLLKTPNMDALPDQSVRFEKFYVSPSCSPTLAALMTGMHEFRNGVTHTTDPREHLNKDAVILPQLLKSAGYRTGFIGRWHLGNDGEYAPDKRGFDWCSTNVGGPGVHFDPVFVRNRKREKRQGYREDIFFDEAMTFIDESKDTPFFCYLATYSPHAPLAAPEGFLAHFRGKVDDEEMVRHKSSRECKRAPASLNCWDDLQIIEPLSRGLTIHEAILSLFSDADGVLVVWCCFCNGGR